MIALDQRVERFGAAAELLVERLGHVAEHARLAVRLGVGREPLLEHLEQQLAFAVREQAAAQPAHLGVGLDRRLHRGLEQLLGLIVLAARGRELVQLEQHLGSRRPRSRRRPAACGARRGAARDTCARPCRAGRRRAPSRRAPSGSTRSCTSIFDADSISAIASSILPSASATRASSTCSAARSGERRRPKSAISSVERGARLDELAGDALADRERGAQILVGRIERERGLERRDRLRRRAELVR